jgi:hypothetical protein
MNDRIKELQEEIEREKLRIKNCKHDWKDPIYDPDYRMEGYGSRMVPMGSDTYWEYAGYQRVEVPRWSRKCRICGEVEYTYERRTVIKQSSNEPFFG